MCTEGMYLSIHVLCIGIGNKAALSPARIVGFAMEGAAEVFSLLNRIQQLKVYLVERKAAACLSLLGKWHTAGSKYSGQLRKPM